jgi:hypothetical protein
MKVSLQNLIFLEILLLLALVEMQHLIFVFIFSFLRHPPEVVVYYTLEAFLNIYYWLLAICLLNALSPFLISFSKPCAPRSSKITGLLLIHVLAPSRRCLVVFETHICI